MADLSSLIPDQLTAAEQTLVDAVIEGRRAELAGQSVRAAVVRALATESRPEWPVPPIGVNIYEARIEGPFDLEGCAVAKPLVFLRCQFDSKGARMGAIHLRDARLRRLALYDCKIAGDLKADRSHFESAFFLSGSTLEGMLRLRGASIGEALALDGTKLTAKDIAVLADGLRLGGPWILRTAAVEGEIRLAGARVGGSMLWEEAHLKRAGIAVNADSAVVEGAWVMRRTRIDGGVRFRGMTVKAIDAENLEIKAGTEAFNGRGADIGGDVILDGAKVAGGIRLGRAHIAGELSARGAVLSGPGNEWALAAAGIAVDQGLAISGAKIKGGLSFAEAVIGRGISASTIEIESQGRAIEGDVMRVGGNWIMRGARIVGSVRFAGAHIEGQIGFTETRIRGAGDLAIRADGAFVRGGWFMGRADIHGLVRLPAARLGNEMRLRGTKLAVAGGPALFASGVKIARELVLDGGFQSCGAVVLDHAEISGMMDLSGSRISSAALARGGAPRKSTYDEVLEARYDESAISLVDARIDRLVMPEIADHRPRGIIDLSRAHVGSYEDMAAAWPPPHARKKGDVRGRGADGRDIDHFVLDGFVYDHLENPSGLGIVSAGRMTSHIRKHWLESQSERDLAAHFKPQAWVQLAHRLAAQGYHDDARDIAIARRRRHRKAASVSRGAKLQGWLLDVFALYGFNPWRTVTWMAVFVFLFAGIWHGAAQLCGRADCKDERVFAMALKGNYGQDDAKADANYPAFVPLAYSLDMFLPFVSLGFKDHWRPQLGYGTLAEFDMPASLVGDRPIALKLTVGGLLYVLSLLEMLFGLILTSLAITGFTGVLKGEEEVR